MGDSPISILDFEMTLNKISKGYRFDRKIGLCLSASTHKNSTNLIIQVRINR